MRACAVMLVGGVLNPRCLREINVFVARLVLIVVGVTTRIFFAAIWANSRRCVSIWRGRAPRGNGWRMSEACSGDVLLGPGVDPRNGEPPAVYQARAGGGLFGVWPSALDQHRWTRQHHTRCTGRGFGVWSASRYLHRAGCGFMQSACSIIGGGGRSGRQLGRSRRQPSAPRRTEHLTVRHGGKSGALPGLSSGRRSQPDPRTLRGVVLARWGEGNGPHAGRVGYSEGAVWDGFSGERTTARTPDSPRSADARPTSRVLEAPKVPPARYRIGQPFAYHRLSLHSPSLNARTPKASEPL